jgi:septal ring factor EnvC (AmiA/AmiB activator)
VSDEQSTGSLVSMALQTVGGILLAVVAWVVRQMSDKQKEHDQKLEQHADRLTKAETKAEGTEQFIREIREDIRDIKSALTERR